MISICCFDFDGTLIDSNNIKKNFFRNLALSHNSPCNIEKIISKNNYTRYDIFFEIFKHTSSHIKLDDDYMNILSDQLDKAVLNAPLLNGVLKLLKSLKTMGIKLFIVSATPKDSLINILKKKKIYTLFDKVFGYPENKIFALQYIKSINDKNILMIGDGLDDREAADYNKIPFLSVGEGRGAYLGEEIFSINNILDYVKNV
tara:strand:+ start:3919 stop:4524 length:606 start_codon:yes stop_codon:yes gene_type:complete